jgi:hypothetical protein
VSVSGAVIQTLQKMQREPGDNATITEPQSSESDSVGPQPAAKISASNEHQPLNDSIRGELRAVMNNYLAHQVGHRLRMSEYLGAQTSQ